MTQFQRGNKIAILTDTFAYIIKSGAVAKHFAASAFVGHGWEAVPLMDKAEANQLLLDYRLKRATAAHYREMQAETFQN